MPKQQFVALRYRHERTRGIFYFNATHAGA